MSEPGTPLEKDPIDIFLGALNVVAQPLVVHRDHSEEMSETAQFYGYEDFGDHFKNVSPRITELVARVPTAEEPGCVIEYMTPRALPPDALTHAADRFALWVKMEKDGDGRWRGNGLVLTLEVKPSAGGKTAARAVLRRDE